MEFRRVLFRNVMFANKTTLIATVINATLEAAKTATFQDNEAARARIDAKLMARIISEALQEKTPTRSVGKVPNLSIQLGYTFTPDGADHTTQSGSTAKDGDTHGVSGMLNVAFHADDESGWEVAAVGQIAVFSDGKKTTARLQSGLAGVQVAWVWSFLQGALQAGPLLTALAGSSRAQ